MMIHEFLGLLAGVRKAGENEWTARCPAHDDRRNSLSVGAADDRILVNCHAGCTSAQIVAARGLTVADLFFAHRNDHNPTTSKIVKTYDYTDAAGKLLYQVCRLEPKDFRMRRPDGDGWTWKLDGVRRVVYRLHELAEAECVWHPEGEKDADRLVSLGLRATTTPGGADAWRHEYADQVKAAGVLAVMLLPDNDPAGEGYDAKAARDYLQREIRVKLVRLPGLPSKGDVSDWLDAGHTVEELTAFAEAVPWLAAVPESPTNEPATELRITLTAEDGTFAWPDGAVVSFTRVTDGHRGVQAEITVTWQGRVIGDGSLNLLAPRSRDGLVKKLVRKVPDVVWEDYLDLACRRMRDRVREGEPVVTLVAQPRAPEQYLVRRRLATGETTVTFAPGGSGKSLDALLLEIAATTGCALPCGLRATRTCPVLVLDWESSQAAHEARLYELCRGLGIAPPETIYYKRMAGALSDSIRQIRADVARLGVGLVRVDSLAMASGREPEGADASTRTMNDLRTLGDHVTRHVIAHVAKTGLDTAGIGHVYGSVFNENIPRNVFEIRRSADAVEDELVLACYHRKANESRLHSPYSLRFTLPSEETPPADRVILVTACALDESPDLQARARTPLPVQILTALKNGAKSIPALATELDAKEGSVKQAVRRLHDRHAVVQIPGDKPPYLWGLAQR